MRLGPGLGVAAKKFTPPGGGDGPILSDDFERSDRFIHGDTAPTGQVWQVGEGNSQTDAQDDILISSGVLTAPTEGQSETRVTIDAGAADVRVTCLFARGGGTNHGGILVRVDGSPIDTNDYVLFRFGSSTNRWEVYERTSGAYALRANLAAGVSVPGTDPHEYEITVSGTSFSASMDGAPLIEATLVTQLTGTGVGLLPGPAGWTLDDLAVYAL